MYHHQKALWCPLMFGVSVLFLAYWYAFAVIVRVQFHPCFYADDIHLLLSNTDADCGQRDLKC